MKRSSGPAISGVLLALLLGCSPAPTPAPEPAPEAEPGITSTAEITSLEGTEWIAESIGGTPVAEDVQSTVFFQPGDKVAGSAGCNEYFGSWRVDGDAIAFGHVGSTRMMCPPPQMDQEERFLAALGQAERFEMRDGALLIYSTGEAGPTRLVPHASADGVVAEQ